MNIPFLPTEYTKSILSRPTPFKDYILIINLDFTKSSFKSYDYIQLPFIPNEVQVTPESTFVSIKSPGRNNPFYQYAGSEDTVEFSIDWYAFDEKRESVINSCRWIESLSKADGYVGSPPRVIIKFGKENILFDGFQFIIYKAPYILKNFQPNASMLPIQAYQTLTLKRITRNNLTHNELNYPRPMRMSRLKSNSIIR